MATSREADRIGIESGSATTSVDLANDITVDGDTHAIVGRVANRVVSSRRDFDLCLRVSDEVVSSSTGERLVSSNRTLATCTKVDEVVEGCLITNRSSLTIEERDGSFEPIEGSFCLNRPDFPLATTHKHTWETVGTVGIGSEVRLVTKGPAVTVSISKARVVHSRIKPETFFVGVGDPITVWVTATAHSEIAEEGALEGVH